MSRSEQSYDAFISHASEDKESLVRPLATELKRLGMNLWFDEELLAVGDSLKLGLDAGLSRSRYGIVVVSPEFLAKPWPRYELDEILKKNQGDGSKVLLPIWHGVTPDEVEKEAPGLIGIVALESRIGVEELARRITRVITPGIKTVLKLLPTKKKKELIDDMPKCAFVTEILESGTSFEDVFSDIMASRNLREFMRPHYERGNTEYNPDDESVLNMIADYDIEESYRRVVEYVVTQVTKLGFR